MTGDISETVMAWATVAAVLVALAGSIGVGFWKWLRRPKLSITFGDRSPLATLEPTATNPEWHCIRAQVDNSGHRGARRVRAQITGVWFRADNEPRADGREWVRLLYMPIPLVWSSRSFAGSSTKEYMDLGIGAVDYLEISRKSMRQNNDSYDHLLMGLGDEPTRQSLMDRMMKVGEYRIEVAVFSDDAGPATKVVSYKQAPTMLQLLQIHESLRPPDEEASFPGHLGDVFKGSEL